MPNFVTLADIMRQRQSAPTDWSDRVIPQAVQTPEPQSYPESPWMPRVPDYGAIGRVLDPDAIRWRQLNPPTYQSEHAQQAYEPAPRPDLPYGNYDDRSLQMRMSARLLGNPATRLNPFPLARDMFLNWWRSKPAPEQPTQQRPLYDDDLMMWWRR